MAGIWKTPRTVKQAGTGYVAVLPPGCDKKENR